MLRHRQTAPSGNLRSKRQQNANCRDESWRFLELSGQIPRCSQAAPRRIQSTPFGIHWRETNVPDADAKFDDRETLRKLWIGKVDPHTVEIETILAIARLLEFEPEAFGPVIAARSRQVVALVGVGELTGVGAGYGNRTRVLTLEGYELERASMNRDLLCGGHSRCR